jgi:hypothetical protein
MLEFSSAWGTGQILKIHCLPTHAKIPQAFASIIFWFFRDVLGVFHWAG